MCNICRRARCSFGCPGFSYHSAQGGRIRGVCARCNNIIYFSDAPLVKSDFLLCEECAASEDEAHDQISFFNALKV